MRSQRNKKKKLFFDEKSSAESGSNAGFYVVKFHSEESSSLIDIELFNRRCSILPMNGNHIKIKHCGAWYDAQILFETGKIF